MKYQNFHHNHNKHKKRDPYEKHQGSYTNGRQVSQDHVYDRNNDGNAYASYARRNYVEYEEKPRVRLKDPYSPDYDSRNHVYTENKPNASNGCYRHDGNENNAIYPNNSAPVGYQPRYRELPYKRKESNRNYSHPYNVKITKPQEPRQQNWSGKQQPTPKQIQNIRQNNVNVTRTVKVEPNNQHTKSTDNQKNDPQQSVRQNSVSTKVNQTHTDNPKANMSNSTKTQVNQGRSTPIASNTKAVEGSKKPMETENKTPKEVKSTGEKTNDTSLTKVKKSGSTGVKSMEENVSQKIESKRMSKRINKVAEEEQEEDESVSKKEQKKKTVAPQRVLRSRKGNEELKGVEASKGKVSTNEVQEAKRGKEGESLKKSSDIVSSRTSRSDTNGVNTRRSNSGVESGTGSGSRSESTEEYSMREGKKSSTEEEFITPRSVGFSEKNNEGQESSRSLQSVKKETMKKTQKKTSKIADIINLNRKITRNTQSFYESQLKMAIELSMKECDGKEKESARGNKESLEQRNKKKEYKGCGNRGDHAISPKKESVHSEGEEEDDGESEDDNVEKENKGRDHDLENENGKKEEENKEMDLDIEVDYRNKEGREKGSGIKGRGKEEHESRDRRKSNKNNAHSFEKKQRYAKKECVDSLTENSDSDSDYDDKPKKKVQKTIHKGSGERRTKGVKAVQSKRKSKGKKKAEASEDNVGGNNANMNLRGAVNGGARGLLSRGVRGSGNVAMAGNIFGNTEAGSNRSSGLLLQGGLEELMSEEFVHNAMPLGILTNENDLTRGDEALLSAVNQCRGSKSGVVSDQVLMDMKMKAFEEFLTMSERLYCGRPLVEDHRPYSSNGALSGMASSMASGTASGTATITYNRGPASMAFSALNVGSGLQEALASKDKESECSASRSNSTEEVPPLRDNSTGASREAGTSAAKEGTGSPTRGQGTQHSKLGTTAIKDYAIQVSRDLNLGLSKDFATGGIRDAEMAQKEGLNASREGRSERDEELFRFNCSKLDLMYRVSFNILKSSRRQPEVIDLWGPKELVLFELALFKYGKEFHEIQKDIPTKSVKEIVDMYYLWKKTSRYKLWKANRYY